MDYLIRADHFPLPGGEAVIQDAKTRPGGSAANCAVALSRLGVRAGLIARAGRDDPGREAREALVRCKVETRLIEEDPDEPTGLVFVIITSDGERTMFSRRGANRRLSGRRLSPESFRGCSILHISGYALMSPEGRLAVWKAVELAKAAGLRITCDPGTAAAGDEQARQALMALLPHIDLLFPNEMELELLSGSANPCAENPCPGPSLPSEPGPRPELHTRELAGRTEPLLHARNLAGRTEPLLQSGLKGVVVTLGDKGCLIITAHKEIYTPVDHEIQGQAGVGNATGAGDAFAAGFLAALLSGSSLEECAKAGNQAGARAVSGNLFEE